MSSHSEKLDPSDVLQLLPPTVPLGSLLAYLEGSFSHVFEERKKMGILKSLTRQEALRVRGELAVRQKQSVVVSNESVCR